MTLWFEWIAREGGIVFSWWLWMTLAGVAVLPLCFRLLGGLPDKGYTLARAIGMLLVTFVFWSLGSYGLLDNSAGSIVLSWLIVVCLALLLYFRLGQPINLREWWRENKSLIITAEILFAVLFIAWTSYRAFQHEILYTEKPMELAFMSAVQRSDSFPPNDPWMAGYAISYYYMGYVMSSMLAMMSNISSTIGFNLTISSLFALTGLTAFGVVYNLVRSRSFQAIGILREHAIPRRIALGTGIIGMIFVVLLGNFQAILIEAPFQSNSLPESYFDFWGTQERANFDGNYTYQPENPLFKDPEAWTGWWWFRASRVLTDYQLDDSLQPNWYAQPIDEFPAFSFVLADNHPHVLALPYVIMTIGLMLNLLLTGRAPNGYEILLYGLAVGGLVFLNTWDGPIYLVGLLGVEALRRMMRNRTGRLYGHDWFGLFRLGLTLLGIIFIAYLPFIIGFRSQAGGILPNLIAPTLFRQYFIMFGPFVVILGIFLLVELWRGMQVRRMNWIVGLQVGALLLFALMFVVVALIAFSAISPRISSYVESFLSQWGGWEGVMPLLVRRRISYGLTSLLLLLSIIVIIARLFPRLLYKNRIELDGVEDGEAIITYPSATGFALLLVGMGVGLSLIPEFFYLQDNFSTRINTIFKFYYQAWAVFSIAGAYAVFSILADRFVRRPAFPLRTIFAVLVIVVIGAGTMYSVFGAYHRAWVETGRNQEKPNNRYAPPIEWEMVVPYVAEGRLVNVGDVLFADTQLAPELVGIAPDVRLVRAEQQGVVKMDGDVVEINELLTLDGGPSMIDRNDFSVLTCLSNLVQDDSAIVAEAVRDAYNANYGRVGALTGIPIILGWENHERQWRGSTYAEIAGSRREDMDKLYSDVRWEIAFDIIKRYKIDYIMYGTTERAQFGGAGVEKFTDNLPLVCQSGESRIFYVDKAIQLSEIR